MTFDKGEAFRGGGIFARLWRRRSLFLAVAGGVFALSVVALVVLPVRYMASGSVIVAEAEPGVNSSPAIAQKIGDPADLESQLLIISSTRVIRLALAAPGILDVVMNECLKQTGLFFTRANCDKLKANDEALVEYVQPHYGFGNVGRSRVLNVSYQASDPATAQKMVNALINAFLDDQRSALSASREQAAKWLWKEVNQLDAELRDDDSKIQEYRRKKGLVRGTNAPIGSERLSSISQQLSSAEGALADAEARLREINADRVNGTANSPTVLASRTVSDLKQQLTAIEVQLAAASNSLGPMHPTLRGLDKERLAVKRRLSGEIASVAEGVKKDRDASKALVDSLRRKMDSVKDDVGLATLEEGSIEAMVRSAELKRKQYSELYKRASELETEKRILLGSVRLVSLAELPTKPFFPKRIPFLAAGLTIALLLGAAAAIIRDHLDKSVRSSSELSALTGEELCVELPRLKYKSTPARAVLFRSKKSDPPPRISLQLAQDDEAMQTALYDLYSGLDIDEYDTIAITSNSGGDGKTFTTLALAHLIASQGYLVLAIECDAKTACFEQVLEIERGPGLIEVLEGSVSLKDGVAATSFPNLDVLTIGSAQNSLRSRLFEDMGEILNEASAYDVVLLDCPPAETLDARILVKQAAGVIFCTRWGSESAEETLGAVQRVRAAGGLILGMAITKVETEQGGLGSEFLERIERMRAAA
jgi:polysaccharide biosynthesis transport protein